MINKEKTDNTALWNGLKLNIEKHEKRLKTLDTAAREVFPVQQNRPKAMAYFDNMLADLHGFRLKEILEHKANGGLVVGTFCLFVPEEIIHAAGGITIKLDEGSQFPISEAETILPTDLCPMIKASFGSKVGKTSPYLEAVDFIVGLTACDGKKKAWEVYCDFVPTYVVELPQKKTQYDRDLWIREIYALKEKVEFTSGHKITPESLNRSIDIYNRKRQALARLHRIRSGDAFVISGSDANLISQLSGFDDPERFTEKLNLLCDELEDNARNHRTIAPPDACRIMISGCPMAFPDWKLHHLIESSQAVVVGEDTCSGARYFTDPVISTHQFQSTLKIVTAIADRYLNIPCPCFTPGYCAVTQITEMAEDCKPEGIIYYVLQFCHGFNIEFYKLEKRLKKLDIPVLKIQTDYTKEDSGQLSTRIEAFLERLLSRR